MQLRPCGVFAVSFRCSDGSFEYVRVISTSPATAAALALRLVWGRRVVRLDVDDVTDEHLIDDELATHRSSPSPSSIVEH